MYLQVPVPSDTNDDLFIVFYAMTHMPAWVVSNDRYRKEIEGHNEKRRRNHTSSQQVCSGISASICLVPHPSIVCVSACASMMTFTPHTSVRRRTGVADVHVSVRAPTQMQEFLDANRISYSFVRDEFFPDPDGPQAAYG